MDPLIEKKMMSTKTTCAKILASFMSQPMISICVRRDYNNNPFADPTSLPPVPLQELLRFIAT